jgi:hypothetical protein
MILARLSKSRSTEPVNFAVLSITVLVKKYGEKGNKSLPAADFPRYQQNYLRPALRHRALKLFHESLAVFGYLSVHPDDVDFRAVHAESGLYRRVA